MAGNPNLLDKKKDELKNKLSEIRKEGAGLGIDMDALWAQTREEK